MKAWNLVNYLWKSMVLLACAIGTLSAAPVKFEIEPGVSGLVGLSQNYSSSLPQGKVGSSSATATPLTGGIASLSLFNSIGTASNNVNIAQGPSRAYYGFKILTINGNYTGAVLVPHGQVKWSRISDDNRSISGTIIYDQGRWINTWAPAINGKTQNRSNDIGINYDVSSGYAVASPFIPGAKWKAGSSFSVSYSLKFMIDAPSGGLAAGTYKLSSGALYLISSAQGTTVYNQLFDGVEVVGRDYSCSISQDKVQVELSTTYPSRSILVDVFCSKLADSALDKRISLYIQPSGASAAITTPSNKMLGVAGSNGTIHILATWHSNNFPDKSQCDGSNSPTSLATFNRIGSSPATFFVGAVSGTTFHKTQRIGFHLCTVDATPLGQYSAQIAVRMIQK